MSGVDVERIVKGKFTYKDLLMAAMIAPTPTSPAYKSGMWRTSRPVIDQSKCIRCLMCWVFCPDMSIKRGEDDSVEVDYDYCKGCGICVEVCPVKAISMVEEV